MNAALAGLAGTTIGAIAGVAGAWLAQRGQLRLQREQRAHDERVRWLDDKRVLYRDLLIAMYAWHDGLNSIWRGEEDEHLSEAVLDAHKLSVEVMLIGPDPVKAAVSEARQKFFAANHSVTRRSSEDEPDPLADVKDALKELQTLLRRDLSEPGQLQQDLG
ncbi:hypothetical protein [Streptomyces sp. Da 82-17]|uniref:hypothetical protein n=1 Tax=Streptomyces sp. Da 82-17 TaxID=3377116 RepID=UPI0038D40E1E